MDDDGMTPLRIFIGYDSREPAAYHVLCHSLLRHASSPISITPLVQSQLRAQGLYLRKRDRSESTEFSLTRYLVPYLSGYSGLSIFIDCDMLCQADIHELLFYVEQVRNKAVYVCQHEYTPKTETKMEGQVQSVYPKKNWSSLMVFRNTYCRDLTPDVVNRAAPSYLHQFNWIPEQWVGSLPLSWNWLVGEYATKPDAKMLHYTLGGPWFRDYQFCDHAQVWFDEVDRAMPSMNVPKPVGV
jgi:hypothetical protein